MPILSEEQRVCVHVWEDVTEERRRLIDVGEYPEWVLVLMEKEDRRWVNRDIRRLTYLKCGECGLLRIKDEK